MAGCSAPAMLALRLLAEFTFFLRSAYTDTLSHRRKCKFCSKSCEPSLLRFGRCGASLAHLITAWAILYNYVMENNTGKYVFDPVLGKVVKVSSDIPKTAAKGKSKCSGCAHGCKH